MDNYSYHSYCQSIVLIHYTMPNLLAPFAQFNLKPVNTCRYLGLDAAHVHLLLATIIRLNRVRQYLIVISSKIDCSLRSSVVQITSRPNLLPLKIHP